MKGQLASRLMNSISQRRPIKSSEKKRRHITDRRVCVYVCLREPESMALSVSQARPRTPGLSLYSPGGKYSMCVSFCVFVFGVSLCVYVCVSVCVCLPAAHYNSL